MTFNQCCQIFNMARCETMIVALVFLIVVDLSIAQHEGVAESFESIAAELKQLTQRVYDLELKDDQQTQKISQLEHDLESTKELNSDLRRQQSEHRELIRDLVNNVDELKGQMAVHTDNGKELNGTSVKSAVDPKTDSKKHGHGIRTGNPILHDLPIKRGRSLGEGIPQVAFSATITPHNYGPLGDGQIVSFDNVLTNVGNGYHAHSGIFTAPVGGVYVVSVTIAGWVVSTDHHYLQIMVNGNHRCWIWATVGDQSSQLLVLNLAAMDEVYVSNERVSDTILGQDFSSFSGFLLFPTDGSSAIIGK